MNFWVGLILTIIFISFAGSLFDAFQKWHSRDANAEPAMQMFQAVNDYSRPTFSVQFTNDGIPELDQFIATLPLHLPEYVFSYTNEWEHIYAFQAQHLTSGAYDVLILNHPRYGLRKTDGHSTHRHSIGTAYERICFAPGVEPYDLPDACRKAVLWSQATSLYINNGTSF